MNKEYFSQEELKKRLNGQVRKSTFGNNARHEPHHVP